jgi:hypothetical protein
VGSILGGVGSMLTSVGSTTATLAKMCFGDAVANEVLHLECRMKLEKSMILRFAAGQCHIDQVFGSFHA